MTTKDFHTSLQLLTRVYGGFRDLSRFQEAITESSLQKLYNDRADIFSPRIFPPGVLAPANSTAWRTMATLGNHPKDVSSLLAAVRRASWLGTHFGFFELQDVPNPDSEAACVGYLQKAVAHLEQNLESIHEDRSISDKMNPARPLRFGPNPKDINMIDAMYRAFGLADRELQSTSMPIDKYFGYRRSAGSGAIVRFSMELKDNEESDLPLFENYFNRHPAQWAVKGSAFSIAGYTHLIGSAKASGGSAPGEGLRFFTLHSLQFGWYVGLLDSRDNRGKPISARVVLVPARQHDRGRRLDFNPGNEEFIRFLKEESDSSKLTEEIKVPNKEEYLLKGLTTGELVQSLIWNGSTRTLHGEPQPIFEPKDHKGLRRVLEVQERLLRLEKQEPNDLWLVIRLLSSDDAYNAVDEFLKNLERRGPKPLSGL